MDKLVVKGRNRLRGEVTVSGAKNAAVAVIPAAVMAGGVSIVLRTCGTSAQRLKK